MANAKEIQTRMKSIRDTMKITNAMYMISSSKLKKARKNLENTEPYFYSLQYSIGRILRHIPEVRSIYFRDRTDIPEEDKKIGYIVVTADKGLAGGYNHNVLKMAEEKIRTCTNPRLYVLGEIGRHYFERKNIPIDVQFHYTVQNPTLGRARHITTMIMEDYVNHEIDEIYVIYTKMEGAMSDEVEMVKLLPLKTSKFDMDIPTGVRLEELDFMPSPKAVMDIIVPSYISGFVYGALVEAFACEQNARMLAMQAATDSAKDMLHMLDIEYNRARQAAITQEITEVIAGAKAQKNKK